MTNNVVFFAFNDRPTNSDPSKLHLVVAEDFLLSISGGLCYLHTLGRCILYVLSRSFQEGYVICPLQVVVCLTCSLNHFRRAMLSAHFRSLYSLPALSIIFSFLNLQYGTAPERQTASIIGVGQTMSVTAFEI